MQAHTHPCALHAGMHRMIEHTTTRGHTGSLQALTRHQACLEALQTAHKAQFRGQRADVELALTPDHSQRLAAFQGRQSCNIAHVDDGVHAAFFALTARHLIGSQLHQLQHNALLMRLNHKHGTGFKARSLQALAFNPKAWLAVAFAELACGDCVNGHENLRESAISLSRKPKMQPPSQAPNWAGLRSNF